MTVPLIQIRLRLQEKTNQHFMIKQKSSRANWLWGCLIDLCLFSSGDAGTEPIYHRRPVWGPPETYTTTKNWPACTSDAQMRSDSPTPYLHDELDFVQGVMVGRGNALSVSAPSFFRSRSSFLLLYHTLLFQFLLGQGCDSERSSSLSICLFLFFNHFWPQHFNVRRTQHNRNSMCLHAVMTFNGFDLFMYWDDRLFVNQTCVLPSIKSDKSHESLEAHVQES